jgi:hypothetical protein
MARRGRSAWDDSGSNLAVSRGTACARPDDRQSQSGLRCAECRWFYRRRTRSRSARQQSRTLPDARDGRCRTSGSRGRFAVLELGRSLRESTYVMMLLLLLLLLQLNCLRAVKLEYRWMLSAVCGCSSRREDTLLARGRRRVDVVENAEFDPNFPLQSNRSDVQRSNGAMEQEKECRASR